MTTILVSLYTILFEAATGMAVFGVIMSFLSDGHMPVFLLTVMTVFAVLGMVLYCLGRGAWEKELSWTSHLSLGRLLFSLVLVVAYILHFALPFQKFLVDLLVYVGAFLGIITMAIGAMSILADERKGSAGCLLACQAVTSLLALGAVTMLVPGQSILPMRGQAIFTVLASLAAWVTIAGTCHHYLTLGAKPDGVDRRGLGKVYSRRYLLWLAILLIMMGIVGAFIGTYLLAAILLALGHLFIRYMICLEVA